jgi:hypothetical protein
MKKIFMTILGVIFVLSGIYEMITKDLGQKWEGVVPSGGQQAFVVGIITFLIGLFILFVVSNKLKAD